MNRGRLVFASLALACASAAERDATSPDEAIAAQVRDAPVVPDTAPNEAGDATPSVEAAAPTACSWRTTPARRRAAVTAPDASTTCRVVPRKLARSLKREVTDTWMRQYPTGRLAIEPGCDRLGEIAQLDLELSNGHGGNLELVRFVLDPATHAWSLRWISYHHYAGGPSGSDADVWEADAIGVVAVRTGTVAADVMQPVLDRLRAASTLEIDETPPPPRPGTITLGNVGLSSGNFGVHVVLVDGEGRGTDGFFVGYPGTGDAQRDGVRLRLASLPVLALLHDDAFAATLVMSDGHDARTREQFAEFFWAARDRGPEYGSWYLRERFVALASALGDDQHLPELIERIGHTDDASVGRTRVQAINAIAVLTGFDRRYDGGDARDPAEVARDVLATCRAAP